MNYRQALEFLDGCAPKKMTLGLEAMEILLEELGHPEKFLKIIHIAGTNGKGSVGAYLSYILSAGGYKTGRYISPSILEYCECIQVLERGVPTWITKNSVAEKVSRIREIMKQMEARHQKLPTPFEIETAMAFLEFAEKKCDVVVLEVGLGGRLDATNAIKEKELAVIASVSMDHMGILGESIEKITQEKAGIIRKNTDVVCYDYGTTESGIKIRSVLEKVCRQENALLHKADFAQLQIQEMSWKGTSFLYKKEAYHINLLGENQPYNAATAIEAAVLLRKRGFLLKENHIKDGLEQAKWPGRFDVVGTKPLLLVDGAHNEDAARSLKRSLDIYFGNRKLVFIVGIFADKEYDKILKITSPAAKKIITIQSDNIRALPSEELMMAAKKYCSDVVNKRNAVDALQYIEGMEEEAVIAFGSLSFLGDIYRYYNK